MKIRPRISRVLVALDLSAEAARKKLQGIYRFLGEGYAWDFSLVRSPHDFSIATLTASAAKGYDGFLISMKEDFEMKSQHIALQTPTAFIDYPDKRLIDKLPLSVFVHDNDREIAETAARHLLTQGANASFVYAEASTSRPWNRNRGEHFEKILKRRNIGVSRIEDTDNLSREELAARLRELQKPICCLAAYDDTASHVIESCRIAGLSVPGDISIIGIGNDALICPHTTPALSSIIPDFEEEGYRAARELQAMMTRGRKPVRREIICGCKGVAQRGSTKGGDSSVLLVQKGLTYIKANAMRKISSADVVRALGVSRRLADLRFREVTQKSILTHILDIRLGEVCRLLSETDLRISEIAIACHYEPGNLKNLFRRHFGMSMRTWRRNQD